MPAGALIRCHSIICHPSLPPPTHSSPPLLPRLPGAHPPSPRRLLLPPQRGPPASPREQHRRGPRAMGAAGRELPAAGEGGGEGGEEGEGGGGGRERWGGKGEEGGGSVLDNNDLVILSTCSSPLPSSYLTSFPLLPFISCASFHQVAFVALVLTCACMRTLTFSASLILSPSVPPLPHEKSP